MERDRRFFAIPPFLFPPSPESSPPSFLSEEHSFLFFSLSLSLVLLGLHSLYLSSSADRPTTLALVLRLPFPVFLPAFHFSQKGLLLVSKVQTTTWSPSILAGWGG